MPPGSRLCCGTSLGSDHKPECERLPRARPVISAVAKMAGSYERGIAALKEQNVSLAGERNAALAERDAALASRDVMMWERNAANAKLDTAISSELHSVNLVKELNWKLQSAMTDRQILLNVIEHSLRRQKPDKCWEHNWCCRCSGHPGPCKPYRHE